jgi:hypothetical protein
MSTERYFVEFDKSSEMLRFAERVETSNDAIELRRGGRAIALLLPIIDSQSQDDDAIGAFLALAGSMRDVFSDDFIDEVEENRLVPSRTFDFQ